MRTLALACAALAARGTTGALQAESELTHSCFNFPVKNFNRANCVKSAYGASPHTAGGLAEGDSAFDFTLSDLSGTSHTLSALLKDKPVVLVWGMWTCPAYQGLGQEAPFDECSYEVRATRTKNSAGSQSLTLSPPPPALLMWHRTSTTSWRRTLLR
jgi:hypothetical protein